MDNDDFNVSVFKACIAWITAVGTSLWQSWSTVPWDKLAQFAAFIYSVLLIIEFVRKRIGVISTAEETPNDSE